MKKTIIFLSILMIVLTGLIYSLTKKDEKLVITKNETTNSLKNKKRMMLGYPSEFAIAFNEIRLWEGENESKYPSNFKNKELRKALQKRKSFKRTEEELNWIQRGPANVPGRARGLIIDPDDPTGNTLFVASAGGGVWKSENKGGSWRKLTDGVINQATPTIAMAASNTDVIYVGTGEAFSHITVIVGDGIYKSTDKGETWIQLPSTAGDERFRAVNRIIIDPSNADILLAVTETGTGIFSNTDGFILKSIDGGESWTEVFTSENPIEQIAADPNDFNIQYATENGVGILKSIDAGDTWELSSNGLGNISGRIEMAISPVNTNNILLLAQGGVTGDTNGPDADLYFSQDAGVNWNTLLVAPNSSDAFDYQILNGQGGYSNAVAAHPFNERSFYAAGVDLFRITVDQGTAISQNLLTEIEENETRSFMDFINFGGSFLRGGLELGNASEILPIEIRFGAGISQKAHRFTVGGLGAGVPPTGYIYEDYVDVPFEAWDTSVDPPRQLMVSIRDQQEDGEWNLIEGNTNGGGADQSREYLYVHNVTYSADSPNSMIAQNGSTSTGQEFEQMYFFWPILVDGASFDPENLPQSNLRTIFSEVTSIARSVQNVTDGRRQYNGQNNDQLFPHVDYHSITPRVVNRTTQTFELFTTSDGGVTFSDPGFTPGEQTGQWNFAGNGLVTTQPYGVDKSPIANEYIFGSQDNGTWLSAEDEDASENTNYTFELGGDGFECVWHGSNPDMIIGGSQFNGFARTLNRGQNWLNATNGLESGRGVAPFISKLANNKEEPDVLFAVGSQGIYRSLNFGSNWQLRNPGAGWSIGSFTDVKVSIADPNVVWAGTAMTTNGRVQVSSDQGETFNAVNNFANIGGITGLATHPTDPNTAFVLFSQPNAPKVIRTSDLGQTWEDLSGFADGNGISNNGFPDVAVFTLFVRPDDENIIWAGTEIGLFESVDNGETWALADNGIPNVSIWDIILVGNQIVVGTHGRGIWTFDVPGLIEAPEIIIAGEGPQGDINIKANFIQPYEALEVIINDEVVSELTDLSIGESIINVKEFEKADNLTISLRVTLLGETSTSDAVEVEYFEITDNDYLESYSSDFDDIENQDFTTSQGFSLLNVDGFNSGALHSEHPYPNDGELITILKKPIVTSRINGSVSFRNVAIVEQGEGNSSFGDEDFNDFVIVETSTNGIDWQRALDGYDAGSSTRWGDLLNGNEDPTDSDFEIQEFNLANSTNPGDTILVRFRLSSNDSDNGFGWVIDDLGIQKNIITSNESELSDFGFSIYPNPGKSGEQLISISITRNENYNLQIYDVSGKLVSSRMLTDLNIGENKIELGTIHLNAGVYIAQLSGSGIKDRFSFVVE